VLLFLYPAIIRRRVIIFHIILPEISRSRFDVYRNIYRIFIRNLQFFAFYPHKFRETPTTGDLILTRKKDNLSP